MNDAIAGAAWMAAASATAQALAVTEKWAETAGEDDHGNPLATSKAWNELRDQLAFCLAVGIFLLRPDERTERLWPDCPACDSSHTWFEGGETIEHANQLGAGGCRDCGWTVAP